MIKVEKDVRDLVRKLCGADRIISTEAALGGTDGYPDFTLAEYNRPWLIELKRGKMIGRDMDFILRPAQDRIIRQLHKYNVPVLIVCGLIGSKDALMCDWGDVVLEGADKHPKGATIVTRNLDSYAQLKEILLERK